MCLVSYIPTKKGFVLSSNRDEAPQRSARSINETVINDHRVCFPADAKGGSWIFVAESGDSICLLNGAFTIHERKSNYRLSRGVMMKSYFQYDSAKEFLQHFDFWDIEPFTMIMASPSQLIEFRWDGQIKSVNTLNTMRSHIWSSCTLYNPEIEKKRKNIFVSEIESKRSPHPSEIKDIHLSSNGLSIENAFVMNRQEKVKTISFTQIVVQPPHWSMSHHDLEGGLSEEAVGKLME